MIYGEPVRFYNRLINSTHAGKLQCTLKPGDSYMPRVWFNIDSGNCLLFVQCQVIARRNTALLSIGSPRTIFSSIKIKVHNFRNIQLNEYFLCFLCYAHDTVSSLWIQPQTASCLLPINVSYQLAIWFYMEAILLPIHSRETWRHN